MVPALATLSTCILYREAIRSGISDMVPQRTW